MLAEGFAWCLIAVLTLAIVEKGRILISHSAAWHPVVLQIRTIRSHAVPMVLTAGVLEIITIFLLWRLPPLGGVGFVILILPYTVLGLHAYERGLKGGCACLAGPFEVVDRRGLLIRNCLLLCMAGLIILVMRTPLDTANILVGLGVAALLSAVLLVANRWPRQPQGLIVSQSRKE
jgi:hypothetical protein